MYYLGTDVMKATSATMSLASSILGFDIVELWTEGNDGKTLCTYVHAVDSIKKKYPDLITGHYPEHQREHILSPNVSIKFLELFILFLTKIFTHLAY